MEEKDESLSLRKIIQALHLIYCVSSFPPADNSVDAGGKKEKLNSTNITPKQIKYTNER